MKRILTIFLLLTILAISFPNVYGSGLLVTPTRVILDSKNHSAELMLINSGNETATYKIELIYYSMDETGQLKEIAPDPKKGELFADFIRFSPKRVTLKPKEQQVVRVTAKIPDTAKDAEYRAHIRFVYVPVETLNPQTSEKSPTGININLRFIFALGIPIFVNVGNVSANANIAVTDIKDDSIILKISRRGNGSLYGDFFVYSDGKLVGSVKGISVYCPLLERTVEIDLTEKIKKGSIINVEYRWPEDRGGKIIIGSTFRY